MEFIILELVKALDLSSNRKLLGQLNEAMGIYKNSSILLYITTVFQNFSLKDTVEI